MYIKVFWMSWSVSLKTLKFYKKMIHCGQLLIVLEDSSWKSLWEMNTFHSHHQRLAHFLCQSIKVRNTLHVFETMKLFNVFILLLHMDADGLRAFYYLFQDSKCICVLSHLSPLQHQTHLFWTVMCFVYCQFSSKRTLLGVSVILSE